MWAEAAIIQSPSCVWKICFQGGSPFSPTRCWCWLMVGSLSSHPVCASLWDCLSVLLAWHLAPSRMRSPKEQDDSCALLNDWSLESESRSFTFKMLTNWSTLIPWGIINTWKQRSSGAIWVAGYHKKQWINYFVKKK